MKIKWKYVDDNTICTENLDIPFIIKKTSIEDFTVYYAFDKMQTYDTQIDAIKGVDYYLRVLGNGGINYNQIKKSEISLTWIK